MQRIIDSAIQNNSALLLKIFCNFFFQKSLHFLGRGSAFSPVRPP